MNRTCLMPLWCIIGASSVHIWCIPAPLASVPDPFLDATNRQETPLLLPKTIQEPPRSLFQPSPWRLFRPRPPENRPRAANIALQALFLRDLVAQTPSNSHKHCSSSSFAHNFSAQDHSKMNLPASQMVCFVCFFQVRHLTALVSHAALHTPFCQVPIVRCPLTGAWCLLPIAPCTLPLVHCPLPIAHCLARRNARSD